MLVPLLFAFYIWGKSNLSVLSNLPKVTQVANQWRQASFYQLVNGWTQAFHSPGEISMWHSLPWPRHIAFSVLLTGINWKFSKECLKPFTSFSLFFFFFILSHACFIHCQLTKRNSSLHRLMHSKIEIFVDCASRYITVGWMQELSIKVINYDDCDATECIRLSSVVISFCKW